MGGDQRVLKTLTQVLIFPSVWREFRVVLRPAAIYDLVSKTLLIPSVASSFDCDSSSVVRLAQFNFGGGTLACFVVIGYFEMWENTMATL